MQQRTNPRPALELIPPARAAYELPSDDAAERAVLASVLADREALVPISAYLHPEMMYSARHGAIYTAMLKLLAQRITPDLSNVAAALGASERPYLIELISDDHYLPSLVESYAARIERAAHQRRVIAAGTKISAAAYSGDTLGDELDAYAQTVLNAATSGRRADDLISGMDAASQSWDNLNSEATPLISTGWRDLDELMGGLKNGDYVVVGARPSVGKTSWALSLLRNICRARSAHPLLFSLEMDREQVTHRLVAMETGLPALMMRSRTIPDEATHRALADGHGVVGSWDWTICDLAGQTPMQIRSRTMRHLAERPTSVVLVDYLGLMAPDQKSENRTQDVAALSLALRNLARDANVPIVALAQLSRATEGRQDHRPTLSDFRDSGGIEQDATHALFLYRDELYHPEADNKGIAELSVAKNRFGPLGVVPMRFDAATTRFDTLSYRPLENYCR